jgi:hypothetical protein
MWGPQDTKWGCHIVDILKVKVFGRAQKVENTWIISQIIPHAYVWFGVSPIKNGITQEIDGVYENQNYDKHIVVAFVAIGQALFSWLYIYIISCDFCWLSYHHHHFDQFILTIDIQI